jgi:hypothetical protein
MKRRRIGELLAFKFWPIHFRATAAISFLLSEHDAMPCTAGGYSAGLDMSEPRDVSPSRGSKITGLFLLFCTAAECEFSKLYFSPQPILFLLSTFVKILNLARPCISSRGQSAAGRRILQMS